MSADVEAQEVTVSSTQSRKTYTMTSKQLHHPGRSHVKFKCYTRRDHHTGAQISAFFSPSSIVMVAPSLQHDEPQSNTSVLVVGKLENMLVYQVSLTLSNFQNTHSKRKPSPGRVLLESRKNPITRTLLHTGTCSCVNVRHIKTGTADHSLPSQAMVSA